MDRRSGSECEFEDTAISKAELEASFKNELTQPSRHHLHQQEQLQQELRTGGREERASVKSLEAFPASLFRTISVAYLFLRGYLQQLLVLLLTGVVAVLACSLRGEA